MKDILIKDILSNYRYLKKQNIVDINYLDNVLFNTFVNSEEEIVSLLTASVQEDGYIPENSLLLNKESNVLNRLAIRDYYIYLVNSEYLSDHDYNSKKLSIYSKNSLECLKLIDKDNNYKDYLLMYPSYNPLLKNKTYGHYFEGVSNYLFKLLNSINSTFYNKITSCDEAVISFLDSLNTIKNWDDLDEITRKEYLKNEIIGRLLYSSCQYVVDLFKEKISPEEYLLNDDIYFSIKDIKLDDELLENAKNIDYSNRIIINKVIELYPYSFDMLRNSSTEETIPDEYYKIARTQGYIFKEDSNVIYNVINSSNYILNDITIKMIPFEDRLKYLKKTLSYYNLYRKEKDEKYLNKFLKSVDCYIRNINYFDNSLSEFNTKSEKIFDESMTFKKQEKIAYLKVLINKYKIQSLKLTLGIETLNNYPVATNNIKSNFYNELNILKDIYLYLQKEFSIDINELNKVLSNDGKDTVFKDQLIEYYNKNQDKIYSNELEPSEELNSITEFLSLISYKYLEDKKEEVLEKIRSESANVINSLYNISETPDNIKYAMSISSLENEIYDLEVFKND